MKEFLMKMVPVGSKERFPFQCRRCGACCRHVKESVPMESLDAFRLARYLRDRGEPIQCMDDVLAKYTIPVLLHESGYMVFMRISVWSSHIILKGRSSQSKNGFRNAAHSRTMISGKQTSVLLRKSQGFWDSFPLDRKRGRSFIFSAISILILIWTSPLQNSSGAIIRSF